MQLDASSNKGSNLRYLTSKSCNMEENFNYNFHHHSKAKTPVQSFETHVHPQSSLPYVWSYCHGIGAIKLSTYLP